LKKFAAVVGPTLCQREDFVASFWPNLHRTLPQTGRLILVHDTETVRLVGYGTLHQARDDAGELKRLYVRPEASGHRLGSAIVDARLRAACDMAWKRLDVSAIKGNRDMLRICESVGFRVIGRYPECSDLSDIADCFVHMQYDLQ
jgi:GNAT superfamily N-acetyltransferase